MREKRVSLTPRLDWAAEQLRGADTVADIGCDHGRLAIALIQRQCCARVIAADISAPSLAKAARFVGFVGLSHAVELRLGDGLSAFVSGECDAAAMLGMGGILMTELLAACELPLNGAKRAVLQPMRGQATLRRYLYENGYHITADRIVREGRRYYQIITAEPPAGENIKKQPIPKGWPSDCFDLGFVSYMQGDPLLPELAQNLLTQYEKELAGAKGTDREAIVVKKASDMRVVCGIEEN